MHTTPNTQADRQGARINPSVSHFSELPDDALIDVRAVALLTGQSVNSVWRKAKAGIIDAPIKCGPKTTRWRVGGIRSYLASLTAGEVSA